jgi:putative endonuclease
MTVTQSGFGHDTAVAIAERRLRDSGFTILDRNWTSGEHALDLLAVERDVLVVCMVKSRVRSRYYATPLEAATRPHRDRLRRAALAWLNAHGTRYSQVRIDVVGLVQEGTGGYTIEHIRGVG